jgi:hypothetical protein
MVVGSAFITGLSANVLKFLTPYSTKLKLTLNPEGAQGALYIASNFISIKQIAY